MEPVSEPRGSCWSARDRWSPPPGTARGHSSSTSWFGPSAVGDIPAAGYSYQPGSPIVSSTVPASFARRGHLSQKPAMRTTWRLQEHVAAGVSPHAVSQHHGGPKYRRPSASSPSSG